MNVITIGRSKDNNNVVIEDNKVSRSHLQIIKDDNGDYYVIDLDSTNGTFVNGNRITGKVQLHKGDIVVIGNTTLSWEAYFNKESAGSNEDGKEPGTSNKKLYIVISSILICVFIGVIAIIVYNNKKNEQNKEASFDKVTQAYSEETKEANEARKNAEDKASRAKMEAETANKEADNAKKAADEAKAKAKEDITAANKKAADAEEAAKKAQAKAKEDITAANKKAADAEEAAKKAQAKAKEDITAANQKAADAEKAAKKAQAEAEESEQLTEEFYDLLSSLSNKKIEEVCKDLKLKGKDKESLKTHFKNANNEGKKDTIKSIKKITKVPEPSEETQSQQPAKETQSQQPAKEGQAEPENAKAKNN